jgi:UDP-N-acetyl-D-glucosamine/UDP-N-acetyl-D-galactosamine dehydrogenase
VVDVIAHLAKLGHIVTIHDPHADPLEAQHEYQLDLSPDALSGHYDAVIGAVAHDSYKALTIAQLDRLLPNGGLLADLKGMWPAIRDAHLNGDKRTQYWSL